MFSASTNAKSNAMLYENICVDKIKAKTNNRFFILNIV